MARVEEEEEEEEEEAMEDMIFNERQIEKIRVSLLFWYGLNRRDLPWRFSEENIDKRAYRVWVSEVMLQQTRVQTVVEYFNRWISKWPTLQLLSLASLEEVNEMWAGLGYYRRARYLLEGARKIVAQGGQFPKTVASLRKIPGIGDYTAGAIASIAFNEAVPVVDGNVVRVISRLKAISSNPKDSKTVKKFWELAGQLVDPSEPGDFNQGLMELGATICTPLSPNCSSCPISDQCRALSLSRLNALDLVTKYPSKVVKVKQRHNFAAVCVLEIAKNKDSLESEFVLMKRPDGGLLAGLWEFPSAMLDAEAELVKRREAVDRYLKLHFGLNPKRSRGMFLREHVGEFVHVFSHIRLKIYVELLVLHIKGSLESVIRNQSKEEALTWKCVDAKAISNLGLTSSVRKVFNMVQKFKQQKSASLVQCRKRSRSLKVQ